MYVRKSPERDRPSSSGSSETSPSHRSVRFSPLPSLTSVNSAISSAGKIVRERKESITETYDQLRMTSVRLKEPVTKKSIKVSVWILSALVLLLVSNILYMVAFLSQGWGWVDMPHSEGKEHDWWDFGLWQCCRHSDGVCRDPRWPGFFSAARCFAVLGLFGNVFTFAWMLGYTLEKLMDYDPCTVASLITLSFTSAVFMIISVCCFGLFWPDDFAHEYHGNKANLSWAYAFAVASAFLLIGAGILGIFEMKSIIMRLAAKQYPAMKRHRKKDLNQALSEDEQTVDSWPSDAEVEDEVFGEKQDDIKDNEFTDIILTEIAETMEEDENEDSRASRRTVKFQGIESEV